MEEELGGYDVTKFKSLKEQNLKLPEYRKVSLIYYTIGNQPLIGMNSKQSDVLAVSKMPNPITELEKSTQLTITAGPYIDLINTVIDASGIGSGLVYKAVVAENSIHSILVGVRNRIEEFLDGIILELEYGGILEHIFESIRERVDSKLIVLCPEAINKLQVVYENVSSGDTPERWSHVASSCRRVIKDVADSIFPAQSNPIAVNERKHKVDDSAYINRMLAGIRKKSNSESTFELTNAMFRYTDAFLKNIRDYASKGDHYVFTKSDASRCLVYTYLLLGDILDYYVNTEKVTKKLGSPYEIKNGIQKYRNRKYLPLEDILKEARTEIVFVSVSHEIVTRFKQNEMIKSINNGVKITIMLLDPKSKEVSNKQKLFGRSIGNLSSLINKQLAELCIQKKELRSLGIDLIIKTYDWPLSYSYIIVDPESKNPLIKIEEITNKDPELRESSLKPCRILDSTFVEGSIKLVQI